MRSNSQDMDTDEEEERERARQKELRRQNAEHTRQKYVWGRSHLKATKKEFKKKHIRDFVGSNNFEQKILDIVLTCFIALISTSPEETTEVVKATLSAIQKESSTMLGLHPTRVFFRKHALGLMMKLNFPCFLSHEKIPQDTKVAVRKEILKFLKLDSEDIEDLLPRVPTCLDLSKIDSEQLDTLLNDLVRSARTDFIFCRRREIHARFQGWLKKAGVKYIERSKQRPLTEEDYTKFKNDVVNMHHVAFTKAVKGIDESYIPGVQSIASFFKFQANYIGAGECPGFPTTDSWLSFTEYWETRVKAPIDA